MQRLYIGRTENVKRHLIYYSNTNAPQNLTTYYLLLTTKITKMHIKFAIIGYGHIGKRHAEMIRRHPEAQLIALCDTDPKQAQENDPTPFFDSFDALLAAKMDIDVVCICTPNGYHAEQALSALDARYHVVCEKPMALLRTDCEKIIYQSLHVSRQVFCVMQNRYSPPAIWIKQIIEEKRLGDIYMVQINCYWNRDDKYYRPNGQPHQWKGSPTLDGGTLFTQFSHFIDMMYWLFGDICKIKAQFANFSHAHSIPFEDSGMVNFEFVNGGFGALLYSTAVFDKNMESSMTIIGSNGSVKIGGQYMNEVEYCHIRNYTMPTLAPANPANDYGTYKGSAANHSYVIDNVVDALKGRRPISTNALEGMKVVEIIEKIYACK
jgi:UDP-N-acetyl-2-amino-2-deoxyglucuronate dehydrogenase